MKKRDEKGLAPIGDILPKVIGQFEMSFDSDLIPPEDLAYTHSVFLQCFMPLRHNEKNRLRWQANSGNASLVMRAGELVKPNAPNTFKECAVPAGPKARIIAAYINDFAWRNKTPEINLGDSMRKFMERSGIPVGGQNGREIQREMENFAAAEIVLGIWTPDGSAHQAQTKIASRMSFWIERNPDQRTLWQPSMLISTDYYTALMAGGHIAPIHWPSFLALQHNPRAMDIHSFLTYRLRNPLKKPVHLRAEVLHAMFGKDCKQMYHFWPRFLAALKEAHKHYPTARVEVLNDCIKLHSSPPLIPYRKLGRIE